MAKVAKTTFQTGPTDKVAVADVYADVQQTTALNVLPVKVSNGVMDIVNNALGKITGAVKPSLFGNALSDVLAGKSLKKTEAFTKLTGAITGIKSGFEGDLNQLKSSVLTDVLGSVGFISNPKAIADGILGLPGGKPLKSITLKNVPNLKVILNGVETVRNFKNPDGMASALNMLGQITGNSELGKVLDLEANFAVANGLMKTLGDRQIPGIVDALIDRFGNDKKSKAAFAKHTLPVVTKTGDLAAINAVLNNVEPAAVIAIQPLSTTDIVSNLQLPPEKFSVDVAFAQSLVDTLTKVDPKWNEAKQGTGPAVDLTIYQKANAIASDCFMLLPAHQVAMSIAIYYNTDSAISMARERYPYVAL